MIAAALLVAALAVPLLFTRLGDVGVQSDEGFYGIVVAELLDGDSGARLTLEGAAFVNKPPLAFWAMAASASVLGLDEFSLRLPGTLASLALVGVIFATVRRRSGLAEAIVAPILFLSAPQALFSHGWRAAVTEPWLALWTLLLLLANTQVKRRSRRHAVTTCVLSILLGLTKGPIGLVLAFLTLALVEVVRFAPPMANDPGRPASGRPRALARLAAQILVPGSLCYFAWWFWNAESIERIARFVHRDWYLRAVGRLQPSHVRDPDYFLGLLWSEFGVWLLFFLLALAPARWREIASNGDREGSAMRLFPIVALLVFSASASKIGWYLQPAYAPLAIVIAGEAGRWCRHPRLPTFGSRLAFLVLAALLAAKVGGTYSRIPRSSPHSLQHLARFVSEHPEARTLIDDRLGEPGFRPREWNRFALAHRLGATSWHARSGSVPKGCVFLVSPLRDPFPADPGRRPDGVVAVPKQALSSPEPDLFVFDFCGGNFAATEAEDVTRRPGGERPSADRER